MTSSLPDRCDVLVIGAGIVGNSLVHHLAELGWTDIVQIDKGPLPNPDVQYPDTDRAAAYVCTDKRCSLPAFDGDRYAQVIARLTHPTDGDERKPSE